MSSKFEFLTGRSNPYLKDYNGYLLHQDIIAPFKLLQIAAKEEINADIQIISSYRNYERQEFIWNQKASGKRNLYDDNDDIIDFEKLSELDLIKAIMRFSALPGASRHHWGTDLDIYDANKLEAKSVQLTPSECGEGDIFCELHQWLDEKIKADEAFGFYRPYANDLGGVSPEKWHLSFKTLASEYFDLYDFDVFQKNIKKSDIILKETVLKNSEKIFKQYIHNIAL